MSIQIRARSDWAEGGHAPQGKMTDMGAVTRIVIHHTSNIIGSNPSDRQVKDEILRIWDMHVHGKIYSEVSRQVRMQENISAVDYSAMTERGSTRAPLYLMKAALSLNSKYDDIGYHYIIDPRGIIWEGRSVLCQGAHAYDSARNVNWNVNSVGIVCLGDFTQQYPTEKQVKSMKGFVYSLMDDHHIAMRNIFGHCDLDTGTVCPGQNLLTRVREMQMMDSPIRNENKQQNPGTQSITTTPQNYTSIA